jgi:hypothetical protein
MSNIQDLEQEVLLCWGITEDLLLLAKEHEDNGNLSMQILGIKEVYEMRFRKAWDTYEKVTEEYYAWKPREVNFDDWGDEASEKRQDIIGQNSNDGLHYE